MIYYKLQGHNMAHEVQTIIQVFYPNQHYYQTEEISDDTITIESILKETVCSAVLYEKGVFQKQYDFSYNTQNLSARAEKRAIKTAIYRLLKETTGISPKWGLLTGIRPTKTINELLDKGYTKEQCLQYLTQNYDVCQAKANLTFEVAQEERKILLQNQPDEISVYIGIPFCPTKCLYCSFTSYPLAQYKNKVEDYLNTLIKEMSYAAQYAKKQKVKTIYIGGGTPTSLNEEQLKKLLYYVKEYFYQECTKEFTVEAGRPDTITKEKLKILKQFDVDRISINPQTMNQKTLELIGRKHTVEEIKKVFWTAREIGHKNINMDLILGLPKETIQDVETTMQEIQKLSPDAVTVHTLAVKRASRLKENFDLYSLTEVQEMEEMITLSQNYTFLMGMKPYYMYRQKNMIGNFENVGYCKPNKEGIYNIQIMEEKQTILALGAGASTKLYYASNNQVERIFNVKSVEDYIARIDEMIERKKQKRLI